MLKWLPVSSLGRRLLVALMLISLVVSALMSAIAIWSTYRDGIERYNNIINQVSHGYQNSLANSLWTYDIPQIEALAQGILNFPSIIYVQIDTNNEVLVQYGDMYLNADNKLSLPLLHARNGTTDVIGHLRISQSYKSLYQSLFDRALDIIVSSILIAIAIAMVTLYVLHRLVTRRLQQMAQWANSFTLERLNNELNIGDPYQNDELSQVAVAINQMRLTLKEDLRIREEEHELHTRLQSQLALAVENAELGFCRYLVSSDTFDCNHHFAKQIGLTMSELEFLPNPMNYIFDSIFGDDSNCQKNQIRQLINGNKTILHDRLILNTPNNFSVLDMSFQVVGYADNKPEHILICSTNRTHEFNLNSQVQNCEQERVQQYAEIEARYERKIKQINTEKIALKRESRRLRIGQQPKHIQHLTRLMATELNKCQSVLSAESHYLLQKFLSLDFYTKLEPIDISQSFSQISKKYIDKNQPNITLSEDLPLTLIAEEAPAVLDFLIELMMHPATLSNTQNIHLFVRLIHNDLRVSWSFTGNFTELSEAQKLAFKIADIIVQMRYSGKFEHKKSGADLVLSITAPFRT